MTESFLKRWERVIKEIPLDGHVIPPEGESLIPKAARIICGHDFIQSAMNEEQQVAFELFIREVLTDLTTNRL